MTAMPLFFANRSNFTSVKNKWRPRESFLPLVLGLIAILSSSLTNGDENQQIRLIRREELAQKTGGKNNQIWLSILGEVFDVTSGKDDFYGPGAGYHSFAGVDATVPFVTGKFTKEEAEKSTKVLSGRELLGLESWRDFYRRHDVYTFVGRLVDPRYFDEDGNPTSELVEFEKRLKAAQKVAAEEKKAAAEERKNRKKRKSRKKSNLSNQEILQRLK